MFADFGYEKSMTDLIGHFKDFYKDKVNENKNKIVTSFLHKDFENIHLLQAKNEELNSSGFQATIGLAQIVLLLN